jgi:peptidoglycan/LPS O-acetylase OafA/YrhL
MFFVLSGYLLFRPYAAAMAAGTEFPDLKNFYLRRLVRIYPPYLAALIVFVLLRNASGVNRVSLGAFLEHASLFFNYDPSVNFFSVIGVCWSLAIELQFYLLLPLACIAAVRCVGARRGITAVVLAFLLIGTISRWFEHRFLATLYAANVDHIRFRSVLAHLDLFGFGMAGAGWIELEKQPGRFTPSIPTRPMARILLITVGAAGFWLANQWSSWAKDGGWQWNTSAIYTVFLPVILCAGLGLLLLAVVTSPGSGPMLLRFMPLRRVGEISYSLYLYHTGVQFFIFKLRIFDHQSYAIESFGNALVCLIPCLAVSALAYWAVERPCLNFIGRFRDRRPRPTPSPRQESAAVAGAQTVSEISLVAP